jgi:tetratricopeptide (TPR) repeat protein
MSNGGLKFDDERAREMIARFVSRFEEPYYALACHASLPLVLTPELLNYLRTRFLFGQVPWVAEADLLLSELCHEVGYELYAMDAGVRSYLIVEMQKRFGVDRMREVARLLIRYVRHLARTNPSRMAHELQAQQWSALVYLDDRRAEAAREIAEQIRKCVVGNTEESIAGDTRVNRSEMSRLAQLIQNMAHQLNEYPELVRYAELTTLILSDATGKAAEELYSQAEFDSGSSVLGVTLPPLEMLKREQVRVVREQPVAIPIKDRRALVVGVSDYTRYHGRTLQGAENAEMMRSALTALGYDVVCISDKNNTADLDPNDITVSDYLVELTELAEPDTLLLIYFSGLVGHDEAGTPFFYFMDDGSGASVSLSEIVNFVSKSKARRQVFIFDLVHTPGVALTYYWARLENQGKDFALISYNSVYEPDGATSKNLTQYLIDALRNAGPDQISADRLIKYLDTAFIREMTMRQTLKSDFETKTGGNPASIIIADHPLESPVTEPPSDIPNQTVQQVEDNRLNEANNLRQSASSHVSSGNYEEARKNLEEVLKIYRTLNDKSGEANTLLQLADVLKNLELQKKAIESLQSAAKIGEETGNWRLVAKALWHRAGIEIELKDYDSAESNLRRVLEIHREQRDPDAQVSTLRQLSSLYQASGKFTQAVSTLHEALRIKNESRDARGAAMILSDLGGLYVAQGDYHRAVEYFQQALKAFIDLGDQDKRGLLLSNIGRAYLSAGEPQRAIESHTQAMAVYRELGNTRAMADTLIEIGLDHSALKNQERAASYYEQALVLFREISDTGGEYDALTNLGRLYEEANNLDRAFGIYGQQLEVARHVSESREMRSLMNLGMISERRGHPEKAIGFYEHAVVIARRTRNKRDECNILSRIGDVCRGTDRIQLAIDYYQQSLEVARDANEHGAEKYALRQLGDTYHDMGAGYIETALEYYEQELAVTREEGSRYDEANLLRMLGNLYLDQGNTGKAIELHEQALRIAREINDRTIESYALASLGDIYSRLSEYTRAIKYYEQGLAITRQTADTSSENYLLRSIGYAYLLSGDADKAIEHYTQSLQLSVTTKNPSDEWQSLANLGSAYTMKGETQQAIEYYERALYVNRKLGNKEGERYLLSSLGNVYRSSENKQRAIDYFEIALALTRELGDRKNEINALNDLGLAYTSQVAPIDHVSRMDELAQKGVEYFEQALKISREIGDKEAEERTLGFITSVRRPW